MRYMSHFRAVHRGSFFQSMRTTEARQLLPDAWGFICPVHTPDGSPCGLLNHLTKECQVTGTYFENTFQQLINPSKSSLSVHESLWPMLSESGGGGRLKWWIIILSRSLPDLIYSRASLFKNNVNIHSLITPLCPVLGYQCC